MDSSKILNLLSAIESQLHVVKDMLGGDAAPADDDTMPDDTAPDGTDPSEPDEDDMSSPPGASSDAKGKAKGLALLMLARGKPKP